MFWCRFHADIGVGQCNSLFAQENVPLVQDLDCEVLIDNAKVAQVQLPRWHLNAQQAPAAQAFWY